MEGPDGTAGLASRRRPLALLAVLAVAGERGVSRDRLAGLLWGDTDDKHALRSLSDALYTIRSDLTSDAVVLTATELRLNGAVVESDVEVFVRALARSDWAAAVACYRGPLLEGFHVPGVHPFEEWLDVERLRFATRCAEALERLAVEARAARDLAGAVSWWRRLAAEDPYNSRVAMELARDLARDRDSGNALQSLRNHVALLRSGLDAEPDAEVLRLIEELRAGAGGTPAARAAGETGGAPPGVGAGVAHSSDAAPPPSGARLVRRIVARPMAAALAVVALLAVGWGTVHLLARPSGPPIRRLAVLPLQNLTGDSSAGAFVDGVTEELTARLGRVAAIAVTSRTSAMQYRGSRLATAQIAQALGVEGVIEGAVVRWKDRVRVTVQTIDARSDRHLGAATIDRPWDSLFVMPAELADTVLRALRLQPTPEEQRRLAKPASRNPQVAALLTQGRWRDALALDSADARAWAARSLVMADSTWMWPQPVSWRPATYLRAAREAADRAILLDSTESEAQHALGVATVFSNDYGVAERALRRAVALQPSNAMAHADLSMVALLLGRPEEALAEARLATRLDPKSKAVRRNLNWMFLSTRQWNEYEAAAREWIRLWPDPASWADLAGNSLMMVRFCQGRPQEALAVIDSEHVITGKTRIRPYDPMRAIILASLGRTEEATATVRRAERVTDVYLRRFWMAWAYAAVGEMDRAVNAYRDAAAMGETSLHATVTTCLADPLRRDPRWPELARLLNLPQ